MRIYDRDLTGAAEAGRAPEMQRAGRENRSGSAAPGAQASDDRVEFSSRLGRLSEAMSASTAERANRVDALRVLYQEGRYGVDSAAVSRAMVSEALSAGPER